MKVLKLLVVIGFILAGLAGLAADTTEKPVIMEFSSTPLGIEEKMDADQLVWLVQVFRLMGSSDFTFIFRKDPDHWMGLYRERLSMVINIHDGSSGFDFRSIVDQNTGQLTVLRASGEKGLSKTRLAREAARTAKEYLSRVLDNESIFGSGTAKKEDHGQAAIKESVPRHQTGSGVESDPLKRLMAGNQRFASGQTMHPDQGISRREEVAKAQKPFAIILTCSDSRLPPELLFDTGLGDLFVVRTAGEVVGSLEIGSVEYAAEHLHATQLLVLGHERCGAVDAAVKGGELPPNIASIAREIKPAVDQTKGKKGDAVDNAVRQNALNVLEKILTSDLLEELIHKKELKVNAAYYDLDTGLVSLLVE